MWVNVILFVFTLESVSNTTLIRFHLALNVGAFRTSVRVFMSPYVFSELFKVRGRVSVNVM